jgi:putative nucleotidyltransferase with HDIG domain
MKKKKKTAKRTRSLSYHIKIAVGLFALIALMAAGADILLHRTLLRTIDRSVRGISAGEIAQRDVISESSVSYIDRNATEALQKQAVDSVPPVFRVSLTSSLRALEQLELIEQTVRDSSLSNEEKIELLREQDIENYFTGNDLQTLLSYDAQNRQYFFLLTEELLIEIFEIGIVQQQELERAGDPEYVELKRIHANEGTLETIHVEQMLTLDDVFDYTQSMLSNNNDLLESFKDHVSRMVRSIAVENIRFDSITTEMHREDALERVDPVIKTIDAGELIIKRGFRVTQEDVEKLRAIEETTVTQSPTQIAGNIAYYLLITSISAAVILYTLRRGYRYMQHLLIIVFSIMLYILIYVIAVLYLYELDYVYVVLFAPILLFSMLIGAVVGRNTALAVTAYLTLLSVFVPETQSVELVFVLCSGFFGAFIIDKAKRRIDLVRSIGLAAVAAALLSVIVSLRLDAGLQQLYLSAAHAGLSAVISGVIVVLTLPVLEHALNLPTDFRLIELTTMNSKVLKRMAVLARGTYSHSVAVADLAENACEAIGANHLLARVGAYYHDIGKIDQPEYFIENQTGDNKHDDLKPSLSVVVIKSHVKLGIEKAKEIGLPKEVIDILAQHHGSDVISYFYREALLKSENKDKISPEDFSYNGTPPMTREAAVVMLADSVDAASRTLKQPTAAKLEKFIWKIIMDKIERKQLVNCDISLRELEIIKNSFVLHLSGRFHTRIEYPDYPTGEKKA